MCLNRLVNWTAKFVRIFVEVKTYNCVSGFHRSALEFSQTFASVFSRLSEGHEEHVFFLKCTCLGKLKKIPVLTRSFLLYYKHYFYCNIHYYINIFLSSSVRIIEDPI